MKVLAGTIIIGTCLFVGTEAFQCPRIASCVEENVTKSQGVNNSSVSREQLMSSLTVSLVSSQKMLQYEGTLLVVLTTINVIWVSYSTCVYIQFIFGNETLPKGIYKPAVTINNYLSFTLQQCYILLVFRNRLAFPKDKHINFFYCCQSTIIHLENINCTLQKCVSHAVGLPDHWESNWDTNCKHHDGITCMGVHPLYRWTKMI